MREREARERLIRGREKGRSKREPARKEVRAAAKERERVCVCVHFCFLFLEVPSKVRSLGTLEEDY